LARVVVAKTPRGGKRSSADAAGLSAFCSHHKEAPTTAKADLPPRTIGGSGFAVCPSAQRSRTAINMLPAASRARMLSMRATGRRLCAFVFTVLAAGCGGKFTGGGGEGSGSGAPKQAANTNGSAGTFGAASAPAAEDGGALTDAPSGLPSVVAVGGTEGGAAPIFVGPSSSSMPESPPPSQAHLTTLAWGQICPWGMAVDATSVYWTDCGDPTGGTVQKVSKTGGAIVTLAAGDVLSGITVEGSNVYWVARTDQGSGGAIKSVSVAGGTPMVVAAQSGAPSHIVADASYVYWGDLNGGGVMKAPLGGGAATMVAPAASAFQIALGDTAIFWMDLPGLMTAPKTGGAAMSLASGFISLPPAGLAVNATTVYFSAGPPNRAGISDVPIDGGAVSSIASTHASIGGGPIAIDATRVYWADTSGAVYAAPQSGGMATLLAIGQDNVDAIAVDDGAVYWLVNGNGSLGGVMELPLSAVAW